MLGVIDYIVLGGYVAIAIGIGVAMRSRASQDIDNYFLSGRTLPWWLAGTSMVATSFAADTPLAVTGWIRDHGLWKNWLWWCYAGSTLLGIFVFARWWRRGQVMTKAELAELRYGGPDAVRLRVVLAVLHAGFTNTITLCWVMLAATKIFGVVFEIDKTTALVVACAISLSYSLLAGFWGVVLTDLIQFTISIVGAVILAVFCWDAVGGLEAVKQVVPEGAETLSLLPAPGAESPWSAEYWTVPLVAILLYMGVAWWGVESVDGGGQAVQRISATRDERQSALAVLWYAIAHYALRPWPWFLVALASLVVLPNLTVESPVDGRVIEVVAADPATDTRAAVVIQATGGELVTVTNEAAGEMDDWQAELVKVAPETEVTTGAVLHASDSEKAYVVMLARYLPVGLLGLVVASLVAAFMSTIDTHVNLASSYFVNDLYRRFLQPDASPHHYVTVARVTGVVVMLVAAVFAYFASSIGKMFEFFLAFLAGVGPVYVLRWIWWRVTAITEIVAMVTSAVTATALTFLPITWSLGPLSQNGNLEPVGRLLIVVAVSSIAGLISLTMTRRPEPATLVDFYRKVRPGGAWGPVRALAPDVVVHFEPLRIAVGFFGGLMLVFGTLFAIGGILVDKPVLVPAVLAVVGVFAVRWGLGGETGDDTGDPDNPSDT